MAVAEKVNRSNQQSSTPEYFHDKSRPSQSWEVICSRLGSVLLTPEKCAAHTWEVICSHLGSVLLTPGKCAAHTWEVCAARSVLHSDARECEAEIVRAGFYMGRGRAHKR